MTDDKKESKKDSTSSIISMYLGLLKWAIGTKSPWAIVGSLVVGLVGAVVSVVFVFRGRKLAKIKHKVAVAKEETTQKLEDLERTKNEKTRKKLETEIKETQAEVARLDAEIKAADKDFDQATKKLKEAIKWKDLQ